MGFQRLQNIPDWLELACLKCLFRIVGLLDEDRDHDSPHRLVLAQTDRSSNRLNDIDLTASRIDEGNTIKRRNIYAF